MAAMLGAAGESLATKSPGLSEKTYEGEKDKGKWKWSQNCMNVT
jgi:hypothetical protein